MTSQDSWIDRDEVDELVHAIRPGETPGHGAADARPENEADNPAPDRESSAEDPGTEPRPETESILMRVLSEVHEKASEGGLLKGNPERETVAPSEIPPETLHPGSNPLWPDFPPLAEDDGEEAREAAPAAEDSTEGDTASSATPTPLPPPGPEATAEEEEEQEAAESEEMKRGPVVLSSLAGDVKPAVPTLRKRLETMAKEAGETFGATDVAVSDLCGYPLLLGDPGLAVSNSTALVTEQVARLSEAVGVSTPGSTQVSLGRDDWLCLVHASSATGGVIARLRVPEPLDSRQTEGFRRGLEKALAGPGKAA